MMFPAINLHLCQGFSMAMLNNQMVTLVSCRLSQQNQATECHVLPIIQHISIISYPMVSYTLWLFNIAMENSPFIDGLPGFYLLKMVIFHGKLLNNQMVDSTSFSIHQDFAKAPCNSPVATPSPITASPQQSDQRTSWACAGPDIFAAETWGTWMKMAHL